MTSFKNGNLIKSLGMMWLGKGGKKALILGTAAAIGVGTTFAVIPALAQATISGAGGSFAGAFYLRTFAGVQQGARQLSSGWFRRGCASVRGRHR